MPFSAVPELTDALLTEFTASLPEVLVADGFGVTSGVGDMLMVGFDDSDLNEQQTAADANKDFATTGLDGSHEEQGRISCLAVSWTGDPQDQQGPRDAVYAIANTVDELCRIKGGRDPAFGVPYVLWTKCGERSQLRQMSGDAGRAAFLSFTIYYEARV